MSPYASKIDEKPRAMILSEMAELRDLMPKEPLSPDSTGLGSSCSELNWSKDLSLSDPNGDLGRSMSDILVLILRRASDFFAFLLAWEYKMTPPTVIEYPRAVYRVTGFLKHITEAITATTPLAFPITWRVRAEVCLVTKKLVKLTK